MSSESKKQERAEILARAMAAMNRLTEEMAAREERAKHAMVKREEERCAREIQRKKDWQINELARIEEGSEMKAPASKEGPRAGYGGYLDGYGGGLVL